MKNAQRIYTALSFLIVFGPTVSLLAACATPEERSETRQDTRVEGRTEERQEERRGTED